MKRFLRVMAACAAMTAAYGQISKPESGLVRDLDGSLRPLLGVAGGWSLGEPVASDVLSAASSGRWSAWKTMDGIWTRSQAGVTKEWPAGPGRALFAFQISSGAPRAAYLFDEGKLLVWRDVWRDARRAPEAVNWQPEGGTVAALGTDDENNVVAFVERDGATWSVTIEASRGRVVAEMPLAGVGAPLMPLGQGQLLYTAPEGLRLRLASGRELTLDGVAAGREMELASANTVILRGRDGAPSLLLRCDRETLETLIVPSGVAQ